MLNLQQIITMTSPKYLNNKSNVNSKIMSIDNEKKKKKEIDTFLF